MAGTAPPGVTRQEMTRPDHLIYGRKWCNMDDDRLRSTGVNLIE
jgi:hypothetical protein